MAVGIVKDGNIIYENYVGYANLEHEVKIDEETRFNIASNAKQFTAIIILRLIEEGKISLDDDIKEYLPDVYKNITDNITVSNLLSHTSGIRDVYDLWALTGKTWWKMFVDNGDAFELLQAQTDLNFKPGTEHLYSNSNYILLAKIVERVNGQDFSEVASKLFEGLRMANTGFLTNYMAVIPHKARPYGNWNGWKEYPSITETYGDGGLFTSLKDQLKWEQTIQFNDGTFMPRELIEKSQSALAFSYGYGLEFGTYKGLTYSYHDGNTGAYNATFLRFPAENISIVVMANSGSVPTNYLAKQIADEILNTEEIKRTFPSGPEKILKEISQSELIGSYRQVGGSGTIINIRMKNDTLYREIYQRKPVNLIQEEGSLFHYASNNALKMAFNKDVSDITGLTIYLSSQAPQTYERLPSLELTDEYKQSLNGTFVNDETETTISIEFRKRNEFTITKNGKERKAELLHNDFLRMNSYAITIVRDEENRVIGLKVNNGRIRNVIFEKI